VPRQRVHTPFPPTTAQIQSHTALPHHAPPQETRRRRQETRGFPSTDLEGSKTRPIERGRNGQQTEGEEGEECKENSR